MDAADHPAGGSIHPRQTLQTETNEYPVDRRGGHAENASNAGRAELVTPTELLDLTLHCTRRLMRTGLRSAGTVLESRPSFTTEPLPPLVGGGTRDPHLRGDVGDRTAALDPLDERVSTSRRQLRVTVHQSLPRVCVGVGTHTLPRGLSSFADPQSVNNVRGHYN